MPRKRGDLDAQCGHPAELGQEEEVKADTVKNSLYTGKHVYVGIS